MNIKHIGLADKQDRVQVACASRYRSQGAGCRESLEVVVTDQWSGPPWVGEPDLRRSDCQVVVRLPSGELDNRQSQSRCFCTEVQWQACNWVLSTNQVLIHCTGLEYLTTSCQNNDPPSSNQQIDFFHQAGFRGGGSSVQVQFVVKCAIFSLHSKSRLVQGGREESRGAKHAGSKWF